jgi:hypothetical protein
MPFIQLTERRESATARPLNLCPYVGLGQYYGILGLIFQLILVVFAIRTYCVTRTRTTFFIMWATI